MVELSRPGTGQIAGCVRRPPAGRRVDRAAARALARPAQELAAGAAPQAAPCIAAPARSTHREPAGVENSAAPPMGPRRSPARYPFGSDPRPGATHERVGGAARVLPRPARELAAEAALRGAVERAERRCLNLRTATGTEQRGAAAIVPRVVSVSVLRARGAAAGADQHGAAAFDVAKLEAGDGASSVPGATHERVGATAPHERCEFPGQAFDIRGQKTAEP